MPNTIVALSSGSGCAGIAVVRVSGGDALQALNEIAGVTPEPRAMALRAFRTAEGELIDRGLVVWFPAGSSFTGEDLVEFHCHGSPAVVSLLLKTLSARPACRLAEPGEFALRAFQDGRLSLPEAEALGDLLAAETEAQRKQSVRLMEGALMSRAGEWRSDLLRALALIEVTIDWADEEVPQDVQPEVSHLVAGALAEMREQLAGADRAERLRTGFEVALVGAPNAGKSSLFNKIAGREAAITSAFAGTTRDVGELRYDLQGLPIVFLDLAGLREASDPVEQEGVRRARERAAKADLRVFLKAPDVGKAEGVDRQVGDLVVATKADLAGGTSGLSVSSVTGEGLPEMLDEIYKRVRDREDMSLIGHHRQRMAVEDSVRFCEDALDRVGSDDLEVVAESLRGALRSLDVLVGRTGVEDVLGEVFSSFCLGK